MNLQVSSRTCTCSCLRDLDHCDAAAAAATVACRFKVIDMLKDYEMGPFTVTPLRVTHSIPDCCGLIMRR